MAETAAALRRKLRRDKEASQTQRAQIATNRGNKLKPGARYVHAGSLPWRYGASIDGSGRGERSSWTERVNHAGYNRDILTRNPRRYNEYGDELEDSESDPEADADAEEENPYGEVKLEELLRPLTHPSDLASHPTMAQAYLDPALPDMVSATDAKIREERNNLWRAKTLYRYFTGDETWIPCERVEAESDWELFGPNPGFSGSGRLEAGESPSKRRRIEVNGDTDGDGDVQIADAFEGHDGAGEALNGTLNGPQGKDDQAEEERGDAGEAAEQAGDVSMMEADGAQTEPELVPQINGTHKQEETETKAEEPIPEEETGEDALPADPSQQEEAIPQDTAMNLDTTTIPHHDENASDGDNEDEQDEAEADRPSTASTPAPPPRRITRALAAENETAQIASPPPTSPSPTLSSNSPSTSTPHPLFLLPSHLATSHAPHHAYPMLSLSLAHSGLPPEELLETRKLLSLYIQKSEETIRGLEGIYAKLVKSKRRREKLWSWAGAEGHVGELSDGEDWVDGGYWGLGSGELRKGRDEDAGEGVTVGTVGGGQEGSGNVGGGGGEVEGGIVLGGRKGKRRGRAKD
ncbi:hypothetical protein OHC33_002612 [Knufia fluminis]|uniref:Transcriptional regulatory protein RXT2 N-terminal domain-containing protein n=1 Tax=Knufia fluminis TaxID=191047 RepID=A0AAN8EHL4_9EURO|nr:hypothetical protein OHC33_002612 [Knufia fluminis]